MPDPSPGMLQTLVPVLIGGAVALAGTWLARQPPPPTPVIGKAPVGKLPIPIVGKLPIVGKTPIGKAPL
jgi:hypothetical protein